MQRAPRTPSSSRPRTRRPKAVSVPAPVATTEVPPVSRVVRPRSNALWMIVGGATLVIVIAWGFLFRWTMRSALMPLPETEAVADVRKEFERGLGEFQKNFATVTTLLQDRFAAAEKTQDEQQKETTVALSPDALRALEERLETVTEAAPVVLAPIDFTLSTWQPFRSTAARLQFRYPEGWVESTRVGGERVAAFVRPTTTGLALGEGELFLDVRPNPANATLREFYRASGRVNLYQAAQSTRTVYVDGIRAVQFDAVSGVTPSTIVSVRHRNRVLEFSVLGTDAEHLQLLQTVLSTVQFE